VVVGVGVVEVAAKEKKNGGMGFVGGVFPGKAGKLLASTGRQGIVVYCNPYVYTASSLKRQFAIWDGIRQGLIYHLVSSQSLSIEYQDSDLSFHFPLYRI
jgi:hypothetical protein